VTQHGTHEDPGGGAPGRLLLVESQGRGDTGFRRDAVTQVLGGQPTVLFLVQDGVMLAVAGSDSDLDRFQEEGGAVAVDSFSLTQYGLDSAKLRPGLSVAGMDDVADWILDPATRVVWH
jgi:sulfur relay (sulfurtransferase) complex TusBCD TusD component (DsrE family)